MKMGINWPYDYKTADNRAYALLAASGATEVVVASHTPRSTLEAIAALRPGITFDVRIKTGPSNQGAWPFDGIDYREWSSEQSAREILTWCVQNGQSCRVIPGNEAPLELTREPVDNWQNMQEAIAAYNVWAGHVLDQLEEDPVLRDIPIISMPLDQGNPERFDAWWYGAIEPYLYRCDFVGEHNYVPTNESFTDADWGLRHRTVARRAFEKTGRSMPVVILECDDDGKMLSESRNAHLMTYGVYVVAYARDVVDTLSFFTLPGGAQDDNKPAWWFLDEEMMSRVYWLQTYADSVQDAPLQPDEPAQPAPEVPTMPQWNEGFREKVNQLAAEGVQISEPIGEMGIIKLDGHTDENPNRVVFQMAPEGVMFYQDSSGTALFLFGR